MVSSSKIKTANGSASSKNVKKNFKEFDNKKYERAINLLKDMKLYEYDYKYDLYKNRHQYGFIIDELQKLNGNELDFIFNFIKTRYKEVLSNPNSFTLTKYKNNFSNENFVKINGLVNRYKMLL